MIFFHFELFITNGAMLNDNSWRVFGRKKVYGVKYAGYNLYFFIKNEGRKLLRFVAGGRAGKW